MQPFFPPHWRRIRVKTVKTRGNQNMPLCLHFPYDSLFQPIRGDHSLDLICQCQVAPAVYSGAGELVGIGFESDLTPVFQLENRRPCDNFPCHNQCKYFPNPRGHRVLKYFDGTAKDRFNFQCAVELGVHGCYF